ncbi:MAG: hypothetical protein JWM04_1389 [Verrucomicrobiales bacterium]|nr:hypothetical protein [Verrucomicrobiales bacterium]
MDSTFVSVREVAAIALSQILKVTFKEPGEYKGYWQKFKNTSIEERWYTSLEDDGAKPEQWKNAAMNLLSRTEGVNTYLWGNAPAPKTTNRFAYNYTGLRAKKNPSFSDLLEKRALGLVNKNDPDNKKEQNFYHSSEFCLMLAEWDPQHARTILELVLQRGISMVSEGKSHQTWQLGASTLQMAKLANTLAALDDFQGLEMYCAWLGTQKLEDLTETFPGSLSPLGRFPNNLAVREASIKLFGNEGQKWIAGRQSQSLLRTRLVCNPVFLKFVLVTLANESIVGDFIVGKDNEYTLKTAYGTQGGMIRLDAFAPVPGTSIPLRICDEIARNLSRIEDLPPFQPYWPLEKRNSALQDIITFLKSNSDRLNLKPPQANDVDE